MIERLISYLWACAIIGMAFYTIRCDWWPERVLAGALTIVQAILFALCFVAFGGPL